MADDEVPTWLTWRWALSVRRPEEARSEQLRSALHAEPLFVRILLTLLGYLLSATGIIGGARVSISLFGAFLSRPFDGAREWALLIAYAVVLVVASFAASAVGVAWLTRRYGWLSDDALQQLLRRGPF